MFTIIAYNVADCTWQVLLRATAGWNCTVLQVRYWQYFFYFLPLVQLGFKLSPFPIVYMVVCVHYM